MSVPDVKVRGIRSPILPGHIIGRLAPNGPGDAQLIPITDLGDHLVATGKVIGPGTGPPIPVASNPTATAKDTAVNGTATTFMRSDAAPAVQKASSSQFGITKVDGTTITASGTGVISSVGAVGANPTATASDTAVNGSATTFMRSDGAPAIQKASATQFGVTKVDGTTITASGTGVISSTGGATGANPTATASDTAVNGSATTFMRSDGAPAIQKTSAAQFGLAKVDGTTITASSGVISAVTPAGANPTATASDTAVNGSATTFMRSDAAPAVQKTSSSVFGLCKVDNTTITASGGTISAVGGIAVAAPTVRGTGIQASSAASFTVSWPSGTLAGDLAIIFYGGGFDVTSIPSGWTVLDHQAGANTNGLILGKLLSSGDISTGHVVITPTGTFDACLAIITFVGATSLVTGLQAVQSSAGGTNVILGRSTYIAGSYGVYFGMNRGSGTAACTQGSSLRTANDSSAATGCLFGGAPSNGPFLSTAALTFTTAGASYYCANLFVVGP